MLICYVLYSIVICIISNDIASIIHELGHSVSYTLLTGNICHCYIKFPWTKRFNVGKINFILSPTQGPFSQYSKMSTNFNMMLGILMGPRSPFRGDPGL
jgi:hypothetical protein